MVKTKPYVISFAGFDPSAGAGILSDIKTFENTGSYGMGIITANTIQNDVEFESVKWIDPTYIIDQYKILAKRFTLEAAKIGLLQNLEVMQEIVSILKKDNPHISIVWDPVLSASAGYDFKNLQMSGLFTSLCKNITLITPNFNEAKVLFNEENPEESILEYSNYCAILLKGGHTITKGIDHLYSKRNKYTIENNKDLLPDKHGTGCVLSSSICSNLGQKIDLLESCKNSKEYIEDFMSSNNTHLGYHRNSEI